MCDSIAGLLHYLRSIQWSYEACQHLTLRALELTRLQLPKHSSGRPTLLRKRMNNAQVSSFYAVQSCPVSDRQHKHTHTLRVKSMFHQDTTRRFHPASACCLLHPCPSNVTTHSHSCTTHTSSPAQAHKNDEKEYRTLVNHSPTSPRHQLNIIVTQHSSLSLLLQPHHRNLPSKVHFTASSVFGDKRYTTTYTRITSSLYSS